MGQETPPPSSPWHSPCDPERRVACVQRAQGRERKEAPATILGSREPTPFVTEPLFVVNLHGPRRLCSWFYSFNLKAPPHQP